MIFFAIFFSFTSSPSFSIRLEDIERILELRNDGVLRDCFNLFNFLQLIQCWMFSVQYLRVFVVMLHVGCCLAVRSYQSWVMRHESIAMMRKWQWSGLGRPHWFGGWWWWWWRIFTSWYHEQHNVHTRSPMVACVVFIFSFPIPFVHSVSYGFVDIFLHHHTSWL